MKAPPLLRSSFCSVETLFLHLPRIERIIYHQRHYRIRRIVGSNLIAHPSALQVLMILRNHSYFIDKPRLPHPPIPNHNHRLPLSLGQNLPEPRQLTLPANKYPLATHFPQSFTSRHYRAGPSSLADEHPSNQTQTCRGAAPSEPGFIHQTTKIPFPSQIINTQ